MEKIIQLRDYEYNKIIEKANLNEQQIEEKALSLWREKGVAEITVKLYVKEDWYSERSKEILSMNKDVLKRLKKK